MELRRQSLWSLWNLLTFQAGPFLQATTQIQSLNQAIGFLENSQEFDLSRKDFADLRKNVRELLRACSDLGLVVTFKAIERVDDLLEQIEKENAARALVSVEPKSRTLLGSALGSVSSRMCDEMGGRLLLVVPADRVVHYEQPVPPFGTEVATKFSAATYEIEEAAKCLALDRTSASAFHSIRCLEAGIRALSRSLQIPDPTKAKDRNWGMMLSTLKKAIDDKWPTSSHRLSGEGEFFENAYAALAAMQNPWRNATMHLDQKYTEEEAQHIFEIVRGFMRKLASRLDENGQPLA